MDFTDKPDPTKFEDFNQYWQAWYEFAYRVDFFRQFLQDELMLKQIRTFVKEQYEIAKIHLTIVIHRSRVVAQINKGEYKWNAAEPHEETFDSLCNAITYLYNACPYKFQTHEIIFSQ